MGWLEGSDFCNRNLDLFLQAVSLIVKLSFDAHVAWLLICKRRFYPFSIKTYGNKACLGSTMDFSSVPSIVMRPTFEDNYILNGAPWDPATQPAQGVNDSILRKKCCSAGSV